PRPAAGSSLVGDGGGRHPAAARRCGFVRRGIGVGSLPLSAAASVRADAPDQACLRPVIIQAFENGDGRMVRVRAAVFPVAGRGTRFLPATKASPKEMLPIVDKPLIQYAVEEALAAGVEKLVFVTGSSKRSIEDHFDIDPELERTLAESGKEELLALVRNIVPS